MEKTKVSILTITYNQEKYISDTIRGVMDQVTSFDFEYIIADDASPDNTQNIVNELIKNYHGNQNIKYIRHSNNLGGNLNFVWGLKRCKGDYIAICEGDDYWVYQSKLEEQIKTLESNPDLAMCTHEAHHKIEKIFGVKEKTFRRFVSILVRDARLFGAHEIPSIIFDFIFRRGKFWERKRTHDNLPRRKIYYLDDFKNHKISMPFCSIVFKRELIPQIISVMTESEGGHQAILMLGAMKGGIHHIPKIMAVKRDQETSITRDKERLKKIRERDKLLSSNNRLIRYQAIKQFANPEQIKILDEMIDSYTKSHKLQ